jgi:type II restriction enzyme
MNLKRQTMIKEMIIDCIREKFLNYDRETSNMPFHHRLIGKDRMDLYSFIHSLVTRFGTSFYEPLAVELANSRFKVAETQKKPAELISSEAQKRIQTIINGLRNEERVPDKINENREIREVCRMGVLEKSKLTKVDIWLENYEGELFLFDIKTVKPNKGDFQKFKRTLLEWTAAELARNPQVTVNTMIGIPYNPYEPDPYERWTSIGMLDLKRDILIANELWNFIGGEGAYEDLLDGFEQAGIELRDEIDEYFKQFS